MSGVAVRSSLVQVEGMRVILEIPDSGSVEEFAVVVDDSPTQFRIRHSAEFFPCVVYLLCWVADMADWGATYKPGRPVLELRVQGGANAAVHWFGRVFERNGGATLGARDILEATGLISDPRMLVWLL